MTIRELKPNKMRFLTLTSATDNLPVAEVGDIETSQTIIYMTNPNVSLSERVWDVSYPNPNDNETRETIRCNTWLEVVKALTNAIVTYEIHNDLIVVKETR